MGALLQAIGARRGGAVAVALGLLAATSVVALPGTAQAAGGPSITIADPAAGGQPPAGTVTLNGAVGVGSSTTSVLYVLDATDSTAAPAGGDCNGDGTPGLAGDDINGDGTIGDVLDCEIGAVTALDGSLAATPGTQVGLIAFANLAQTANLSLSGSATFVAPGQPALAAAARSVVRNAIGVYTPKDLGGSGAGTAFNNAVSLALSTMAAAGPGPKQVMFFTDGQAPLSRDSLQAVHDSGVKWRSFAVGYRASCAYYTGPAKLAAASGESCTAVASPTGLAAGLAGSQPDSIQGVTATINGVSVKAAVNAVGGWSASFSLTSGTYTATATATLTSGATVNGQRTFSVGAGGSSGSVGVPGGAAKGTAVHVRRPAATRAALPARVTGWVGKPGKPVVRTKALIGAKVWLQSRSGNGTAWTTVDKARAGTRGEFALAWSPRKSQTQLRVVLRPFQTFGSSSAVVPKPPISACTSKRSDAGWTMTCHTIAATGTKVRVLRGGSVVDRSKVANGGFTVAASGRPAGHVLVVDVSRSRHLLLAL